jgi:hypothetical protein
LRQHAGSQLLRLNISTNHSKAVKGFPNPK